MTESGAVPPSAGTPDPTTDLEAAGSGAADDAPAPPASIERGAGVIRAVVERLPLTPGVYRMLDAGGTVLYVGKARSLKKRVANYTQPLKQSVRIRRMIAETATMEIVTTHTEVEALLLESNLIKRYRPRFNVLLRDDKSFPHILLTGNHPFPQVTKHRGARSRAGDYFGPFASGGAVSQALIALQRAFLLRNCSDAIFAARTRPCLQYQIKRCAAPCVDRISQADYAALVDQARRFLSGQSRAIQTQLAEQMQAAAEALDYEQAARLRDRLRALTFVQQRQDINVEGVEDADVIALHQAGGQSCVQIFFFRGGGNYGTRSYFPVHERGLEGAAVLAAFIGQFYDDKLPPPLLLLSEMPDESPLLAEALTVRAGRKVVLAVPQRGPKHNLIDHALTNAREALGRRMAESGAQATLLAGIGKLFDLPGAPRRVEVYDNSHTGGTNALGGMIVAGPDGFLKTAYRKYNMRGLAPDDPAATGGEGGEILTPGDDYAMMRQMLRRRFARQLQEDPDRQGEGWPDLLLIDGGPGQLSAASGVLADLGLSDLPLVAIAKGPDRDAGRERFFMPDREPFQLPPADPMLYFLQRLRDEAHRFAIGSHRARRSGAATRSELDEIAGIGAKRRKALLHHFGSVRAIARAGLEDLATVPGISHAVAKKLYDHFHAGG